MIEEKKIAKDYSQMFWGAIWVGGRSELVIMDRDLNLGRGVYSSVSICNAMEEGLPPG